MSLSRRSFVVTAATLAAGAASAHASPAAMNAPLAASLDDDPLGVRGDFPAVRESLYLNSAYIAPVPTSVVAAGREFLERKSTRPISLGEMLAKTDVVRGQFARLVNASADEIAFLFATS